jgi:hypothetical protein
VRRPPRLTQERLHEILRYEPQTGEFRWRQRVSYAIQVGDIAGSRSKAGYWCIHVSGRSYKAHQLAWLYVTGVWGRPTIDHRDLDKANNRWSNLRRATRSANGANRRRHRNNACGFKGVYLHRKSGKWHAQIRKDGKAYYLGSFSTPQDAHKAYVAVARDLFGEFARAE